MVAVMLGSDDMLVSVAHRELPMIPYGCESEVPEIVPELVRSW